MSTSTSSQWRFLIYSGHHHDFESCGIEVEPVATQPLKSRIQDVKDLQQKFAWAHSIISVTAHPWLIKLENTVASPLPYAYTGYTNDEPTHIISKLNEVGDMIFSFYCAEKKIYRGNFLYFSQNFTIYPFYCNVTDGKNDLTIEWFLSGSAMMVSTFEEKYNGKFLNRFSQNNPELNIGQNPHQKAIEFLAEGFQELIREINIQMPDEKEMARYVSHFSN